jgi:hypothetical protein
VRRGRLRNVAGYGEHVGPGEEERLLARASADPAPWGSERSVADSSCAPVAGRAARPRAAEPALDVLSFDGPRARLAGLLSGLDVGYDLGEGHPLLGRRMPDLDLTTAHGPRRVFELLHDARPVLLNLGEPGSIDITPWTDRVRHIDADHTGTWELPVIGTVTAPVAVLIRPDGHVAWVGDGTRTGLSEALTTWFGEPAKKDVA